MPKKKKKPRTKKKPSKKRKVNKKKSRTKKKPLKKIYNKKSENSSPKELIFKTKQEWIRSGLANKSQYQSKYNESIKNNNSFWKKEGKRITWIKPYKKIKDVKYSKEEVKIKWYEDGTLNASANCIDRH